MANLAQDFKIVIADDDTDDQTFISDALAKNNFSGKFEFVDDGEQLLALLRRQDDEILPDLILLDLNMPFKDGYQALVEIRQDPNLRGIPTLILTSASSSIQEKRCYDLGATGFFSKPVSMADYDKVASGIMMFVQSIIGHNES